MLAIGCDHGGYTLKEEILKHLEAQGVEYMDCGCFSADSVDYPDIAEALCANITDGSCEKGILLCGTGVGMSMSANKAKGIRACVCSDTFSAHATRAHNDANVLCMGERVVGIGLALDIVEAFLTTEFEGGRHARRVAKIAALEE